jgi:hypothetical protein
MSVPTAPGAVLMGERDVESATMSEKGREITTLDPSEDPKHRSKVQRWIMTAIICLSSTCVTYNSSVVRLLRLLGQCPLNHPIPGCCHGTRTDARLSRLKRSHHSLRISVCGWAWVRPAFIRPAERVLRSLEGLRLFLRCPLRSHVGSSFRS